MRLIIAHIAGIPLEESLVMAVPVLGAMYVALMASLVPAYRASRLDPLTVLRAS